MVTGPGRRWSHPIRKKFVLCLKDFKGSRRREEDKPGGREQFQQEATKGERAGSTKQEKRTVTPTDDYIHLQLLTAL